MKIRKYTKHFVTLVFVALIGDVAMATETVPFSCSDKSSDYAVHVNHNHKTAVLTVNGLAPEFGNLECRKAGSESAERVFLICSSPNVADGGFTALFYLLDSAGGTGVRIVEESYIGPQPRANIRCAYRLY